MHGFEVCGVQQGAAMKCGRRIWGVAGRFEKQLAKLKCGGWIYHLRCTGWAEMMCSGKI